MPVPPGRRRPTGDRRAGLRPAALRHGRLGRRRQVDADRPAALRHQGDLRGPARAGRGGQPAPPRRRQRVDLALLTDGLRAEREQGITIDVAYRYFATPRRKFIIADTPGHEQYTRNMVTGASTADLAIVLVDARNGVVEQSRRHAFIASLLRIPHLVVAVNKMDLVDWDEASSTASSRTSRTSPRARRPRHHVHPHVRARGRQRRRPLARTCPGTRARRCSTTSSTCTSPRTATSPTCASRCSG